MDTDHSNELLSDEDRRSLVAQITSEIKVYKYAGIFLNFLAACFLVATVVVGFVKANLLIPFISIDIVVLILATAFYFIRKPFQRTLAIAQQAPELRVCRVTGILKRAVATTNAKMRTQNTTTYIYTVGDTDLPHIVHGYEDTVMRAYAGQIVTAEYIVGVNWNKLLYVADGSGYDFIKQKPIINSAA